MPVTSYEDYRAQIEHLRQTGEGAFTSEPVLHLAPTSGSQGARKLIPYTASHKRAFRRGIDPWIFCLYLRYPWLFLRKQFWLVTPSNELTHDSVGAVRVGFDEDEEYLGSFQQWLLRQVWVQIPQREKETLKDYLSRIVEVLSGTDRLGLISLWSPNILLDPLDHSTESKLGSWSGLVSCWTDGFAEKECVKLQKHLPRATVQPKGLLSTEAFVTLPIGSHYLLSYNSHYFEFRESADSVLVGAHELVVGRKYEVVVTTHSGFVRYATGDIVTVTATFCGHPTLRLVGRERTVDLCGEKLHETFVTDVVTNALQKHAVDPSFWFVAPRLRENKPPQYVLYLSSSKSLDVHTLAAEVEKGLRDAYHYNLCQQYGQLSSLEVSIVAVDHLQTAFVQQTAKMTGAKPGSVKISRLSSFVEWDDVFSSQT